MHPRGVGRSCHWLRRGALTASLRRTISCCCSVNAKQTFLSPLSTAKVRRLRCRPGEYSVGCGAAGRWGTPGSAQPEGEGSVVSPTRGGRCWGRGAEGCRAPCFGDVGFGAWGCNAVLGVQIVGMGEAKLTALVSSRSGALCSPGGPQRSVLGMRCWGCRAAGLSQWHRGGSGHLSPSLWPLQPRALTRGRAAAPGLALWWSYSSSVLQNPTAGLCLSTP